MSMLILYASRENTMLSATAVFNLMSLACARSGHYKVKDLNTRSPTHLTTYPSDHVAICPLHTCPPSH